MKDWKPMTKSLKRTFPDLALFVAALALTASAYTGQISVDEQASLLFDLAEVEGKLAASMQTTCRQRAEGKQCGESMRTHALEKYFNMCIRWSRSLLKDIPANVAEYLGPEVVAEFAAIADAVEAEREYFCAN